MAYALCGSGLWRLPGARLVGGAGHTAHTACHTAPAPCPLTPEYDAAGRPHSHRDAVAPNTASARLPLPALASLLNRLRGRPPLASCGLSLCCGRPSPSRAGVCVMSRRAGKLPSSKLRVTRAQRRPALSRSPLLAGHARPQELNSDHTPRVCARTVRVGHTLSDTAKRTAT